MRSLKIVSNFLLVILLSACRPGQIFGPTITPTPTNTATPTVTPTPTKTATPTPTLTPTFTPTPSCVEPPAGLISWWPGEGNANDINNGNKGTLLRGASFATGMVGQAFSFNKISRVSAPTTGLPTGSDDRTLELWVNVNKFYAGEAFFAGYGRYKSYNHAYNLGAAGDTLFFSQWGDALFGPKLQAGRWYHIAVTNASTLVTLYVDGKAVASKDMFIDTPKGFYLYMGSLPNESDKRLDGLIDEVSIYNRALSAEEIQVIYLAGSLGKCK